MIDAEVDRIRAVKRLHTQALLKKANVVGVGIGYTYRGGEKTDRLGLVVLVQKKVPEAQLKPDDRIPPILDGVPVDVQEVGKIEAQDK